MYIWAKISELNYFFWAPFHLYYPLKDAGPLLGGEVGRRLAVEADGVRVCAGLE